MHKLIRVFAGRTGNLVGNAMPWLNIIQRDCLKLKKKYLLRSETSTSMHASMWTTKRLSQRRTKPTIRLVRLAKTQINLHIRAVLSEYLLIAFAFYNLRTIQRNVNENLWHTGWMYRLIWVFPGLTSLIVSFVVRCLKFFIVHIMACIEVEVA